MSYNSLHELPTGTLLHGRYRILSIIGQGGFGITYKAEDERLAKSVCIKELFIQGHCTRGAGNSAQTQGLKDLNFSDFRERVVKEARRLARFKNPGIVEVLDVFEEHDTAYYCMEFIEGEPLSKLIERKGKLSVKEALDIFLPLLDAVEGLHEANPPLMHCAIKPVNIIIGNDTKSYLIDFMGLNWLRSRDNGDRIPLLGFNNYHFDPPEYFNYVRLIDQKSDIFQIGGTLFTLLTGQLPWDFYERSASKKTWEENCEKVIIIKGIARCIKTAMALEPGQRYTDISAFRSDLLKAI